MITQLVCENTVNAWHISMVTSERDCVLYSTPDQEIHSVAMTCFEKLLQKYFAIEISALMETGSRVYEQEK